MFISKRNALIIAGLFVLLGGLIGWYATDFYKPSAITTLPETTATTKPAVLYWYDPMSPDQHFDKPGKSPFMDMDLIPKYAQPIVKTNSVTLDAGFVQNSGVRLASVEKKSLAQTIEVSGRVVFNEQDVTRLRARSDGFIEKVYAHTPFSIVKKGEPLVDVRFPAWYGAEQEYLLARKNAQALLVKAARNRLVQLGLNEAHITELEKTGIAKPVLTLTVPRDGVVQDISLREGMTITKDMELITIYGQHELWLEAAIPENKSTPFTVESNISVQFDAYPDKIFSGKVIAILPEVNTQTRTNTLRVALDNAGNVLRPGMFGVVKIEAPNQTERLWVPSEAVIATGQHNYVIVKNGGNQFAGVEVTIGIERESQTEISSGLQAGDKVVASGQFLIDSEANFISSMQRLNQRSQK